VDTVGGGTGWALVVVTYACGSKGNFAEVVATVSSADPVTGTITDYVAGASKKGGRGTTGSDEATEDGIVSVVLVTGAAAVVTGGRSADRVG
jgi:hypothetical protein